MGALSAVSLQNLPALQIVGVDKPVGQYVVGWQVSCVAADEPVGQKYPAAHAPLTTDRPAVAQYDPAVQFVGTDMPVVKQNVEIGQIV